MKYVPLGIALITALGSSAITAQVIYNNASTAAEGYANGLSNVIQAEGQRNLSDSQAAINLTDARNQQIDNQVKSVNAYWEKKGIYSQHQQEQFAQVQRQRAAYMAKYGLKSLTPEEFDRNSGTVNWLKVLEQKQYDPYRLTLDKLFRQRAYAGALTGEEYIQATAACKDWREALAKQKDVYPWPILDQMIRFVLKVNRELNENLG